MIDMRDEEEDVDSLSLHSQARHESLHNQYNKLKEDEDQWQDVSHVRMNATCNRAMGKKQDASISVYIYSPVRLWQNSVYGQLVI